MKKLYWLALPLFMGTATSFLKADEINNLAAALKDIIISSAPLSDLDWKLKTALNNEKFEKLLNQIETKKEESVSGVPILSNIPILGRLFSSKKAVDTKTNVLIFVTPKILEQ